MKTSEQIDKVLKALLTVKQQLQPVVKGTKNPFFKSSYADLNAHLETVEPLLLENGLVLIQPIVEGTTNNIVVSRIYHVETGQYVESSMKLHGETDMQKSGSAVTYARRYTLGSLLSMSSADDDGNLASGKVQKTETKTTATVETKVVSAPKNKPSFRDRLKNKQNPAPIPTTPAPVVTSSGDDL